MVTKAASLIITYANKELSYYHFCQKVIITNLWTARKLSSMTAAQRETAYGCKRCERGLAPETHAPLLVDANRPSALAYFG